MKKFAALIVFLLLASLSHAQAPPSQSPVKAHRSDQISHDPTGSAFFTDEDDVKKALNALGDAVQAGGPGGGDPATWSQYPATQNVDFANFDVLNVQYLNHSFLTGRTANLLVTNASIVLDVDYDPDADLPDDPRVVHNSSFTMNAGNGLDVYIRYQRDQLIGGIHDELIFKNDNPNYTVYYNFDNDVLIQGDRIVLDWASGDPVSVEHDSVDDTMKFKGAGGYDFDEQISWVGDGRGARLEQELNLFEWPLVTPGWWALYGKEDGVLDPYWYLENVVDCVDEYSGNTPDGADNCPGTMTADQDSGSAGDDYCDSFIDWGACYPVKNKQRIITDQDPLGADNLGDHTATEDLDMDGYNIINQGTPPSMVDRFMVTIPLFSNSIADDDASFTLAKFAGFAIDNLVWGNDFTAKIPVPVGHEVRIESISLTAVDPLDTDLKENCTLYVSWSDDLTATGSCANIETSAGCAGSEYLAIAHTGPDVPHTGPDDYPRLENGPDDVGGSDQAYICDFNGDSDCDDDDLSASVWWRLGVDHRHECSAASTNPGDGCSENADCPSGTCIQCGHGGVTECAYECYEMSTVLASVVYTLYEVP
jgi:hypothetical protein